jgi:hypothetical protein
VVQKLPFIAFVGLPLFAVQHLPLRPQHASVLCLRRTLASKPPLCFVQARGQCGTEAAPASRSRLMAGSFAQACLMNKGQTLALLFFYSSVAGGSECACARACRLVIVGSERKNE